MNFRWALAALCLVGCTSKGMSKTAPVVVPDTLQAALSWEVKPERKTWSVYVFSEIERHFQTLDLAKDPTDFCPGYNSLTKAQRMTAWSELISAMAKFESGWNPKSNSVDVGSPGNRDTWSAGLMQVSVADQSWAGGGLKFTFEELLTPEPNLKLAMQLMKRQIEKTGYVFLPNSSPYRYWAVILRGNRYSQIPAIVAMTKRLPFCK